jgi:hypothetical protein
MLKHGKQPEDKLLSGLIGKIFQTVTSSDTFVKLLKGQEDKIVYKSYVQGNDHKEVVIMLQEKFDELIHNYNLTHSAGQIDLAGYRK